MYISGIPEAPDLEVVKDYLNAKLKDAVVESCKVLRPTVVRFLATEVSSDLPGRTFLDAQRRENSSRCGSPVAAASSSTPCSLEPYNTVTTASVS